MDIVGGKGRRKSGRVGKVGATFRRLFVCRLWPGRIDRPGLAAEFVLHREQVVWQSGTSDKLWEEDQYNLPPLLFSGEPVGGIVQTMDDGGRNNLTVKIEDNSTVYRLW